MTKNQKLLLGILIALAGVAILAGLWLFRSRETGSTEEQPEERQLITQPVNIIDVVERPYLTLVPRNDGREITLGVETLNKPANEVEFELEYSAGSMIQGAFGSIDLAEGSGTYDVLLGSCSAGGACSYHQDVTGGSATLHFIGSQDYAVKIAWRFQDATVAQGKYGTQDQRFQIEGTNVFNRSAYVIMAETSGLPAQVEGDILAGPYGVFPSAGIGATDEVTVNIRLADEAESATIWGWDGTGWVELETEVEGRAITSTGLAYSTYVVTE